MRKILNKLTPITVFNILFICCIVYTLVGIIWFRVHPYNFFSFFYTHEEIGVDFFGLLIRNLREEITAGHPYPPLSYILYYLLRRLSLADTTSIYGKYQQLTHLLFIFIPLLTTILITTTSLAKERINNTSLFAFLICFTYSITGCIVTANLSIVTVPLTLYFCLHYNSNNKIESEIALLFLAIATSLKLTPAVFAFLLICDKNYYGLLRLILYCALLSFGSVLFFDNGHTYLENLIGIIRSLFVYSSSYHDGAYGGGMILHYISSYFKISFGNNQMLYGSIISKIMLLLSIVLCYKSNSLCVKTLILAISHTFIGAMMTHSGVIFIVPLILYVREHKNAFNSKENIILYIAILLLVLPYRLMPIAKSIHDEMRLHTFILEIVMYVTVLTVLIRNMIHFLSNHKLSKSI